MLIIWSLAHNLTCHDRPELNRYAYALVLLRALHIADRMRCCVNKTCPAPYFIAKLRSQKYCGADCAAPALRASKLKWWTENRSKKCRKATSARRQIKAGSRKKKAQPKGRK